MTYYWGMFYYLFILVFGSLFAFTSQVKASGHMEKKFYFIPFSISFVILFIFTCFTNSGDDYDSFCLIIDNVNWDNLIFGTSEIGFNLLCVAIKTLVGTPDMVMFVLKGLSLVITFWALYLLRDTISIGFSYCSYVLLYWLPSLFVIPLFFSAALCTLAYAYYLKKEKKVLPIILILLAAQIHTAAYFAGIFYFFIFFLKRKNSYTITNIILIGAAAIGVMFIALIMRYLSSTNDLFHYDEYERNAGGTGLKTILEYMLLLFIIIWIKWTCKDNYYSEQLFCFYIFDLAISAINFSFGSAGRMHYLVMAFYIIMFSKYCYTNRGKFNFVVLLIWLLCLVNGFLTYRNFTEGPNPYVEYQMFNPFDKL